MSEPTSSPSKVETVPCFVCGGEIQKMPEHLYQFRNQTGNGVLFLQLTTAVPPKHPNQKAKFNPAPICLACAVKIIGNFIVGGKQMVSKIVIGEPKIEGLEFDDCSNAVIKTGDSVKTVNLILTGYLYYWLGNEDQKFESDAAARKWMRENYILFLNSKTPPIVGESGVGEGKPESN